MMMMMLNEIELICLGDLHIGDHNCDYQLLNKQIDYINSKPNIFVIGMGDYINNALKLSKTDVYSAVAPHKEFQLAIEIFKKIPGWIADPCILPGHTDADPAHLVAFQSQKSANGLLF